MITVGERTARMLRRILAQMPKQVRLMLINRIDRRGCHKTQFRALRDRFGEDHAARSRFLVRTFHCRTLIDPQFVRIIKKLQSDFQLKNFVETGTLMAIRPFC